MPSTPSLLPRLSAAKANDVYHDQIRPTAVTSLRLPIIEGPSPQRPPMLTLMAETPGSPQQQTRRLEQLLLHNSDRSLIIIDPDQMRPHHPAYYDAIKRFDHAELSLRDDSDVNRWSQRLLNEALDLRADVMWVTASTNAASMTTRLAQFQTRGWKTTVAIAAVHPQQGLLNSLDRFNRDVAEHGHALDFDSAVFEDHFTGVRVLAECVQADRLANRAVVYNPTGDQRYFAAAGVPQTETLTEAVDRVSAETGPVTKAARRELVAAIAAAVGARYQNLPPSLWSTPATTTPAFPSTTSKALHDTTSAAVASPPPETSSDAQPAFER